MNFIETLVKNNQYPIIFIGSGITQRYFQNAPTWEGLLKKLWNVLYEEDLYYSKYHELESKYNNQFEVYTKLATELEQEIDNAFYNKKIEIKGLSLKQAHEKKISPFRQLIANIFLDLELKDDVESEVEAFCKMLLKARLIITTNYDTFIEDCFKRTNTGIKINVGNKGLFSKSSDYGELFKIHGSVKEVNTISFTEEDYRENEEKSPIVNAKILSTLTESPIIFLGYSLNDKNIRKLLIDFSKNLPNQNINQSASRIGIVEYSAGEENIIEYTSTVENIGVYYTALKTDNYSKIYSQIAKIEQGISPSEISKYETLFRRIIQIKGEEKELETVISTFVDIKSLKDEEIRNKSLVVAFGDSKYIYKIPTYKDYIKSYFGLDNEMPIEIVVKYLSISPLNTPIPIEKYSNQLEQITNQIAFKKDKEKYLDRIDFYKDKNIDFYKKQARGKLNKALSERHLKNESPLDIYRTLSEKDDHKINYILAHIDCFSEEEVKELIINILKESEKVNFTTTVFRKLFKVCSLLMH